MGIFKDLHKINKQAKEIGKNWDSKAQLDDGLAKMRNANAFLAQQTTALNLATSGTAERAEAQITATRDTGSMINLQPVIEINLMVFREGLPPYPVTIQQTVAMTAMHRITPGTQVTIELDPTNPNTVLLNTSL